MTDPYVRRSSIRGRIGTTGPIGQPVRDPLGDIDFDMTEATALYVGTLEGQLAAYAINEVKYRVLLELITGESWWSTKVDVDTNVLGDLAVDALIRRGMDGTEARTLVNKRISFGVEEQAPPVMPEPEPETEAETSNMATRLARWQERQGHSDERSRRREPRLMDVVSTETRVVEEDSAVVNETPTPAPPFEPEPNIRSTSSTEEPEGEPNIRSKSGERKPKHAAPQEDSPEVE